MAIMTDWTDGDFPMAVNALEHTAVTVLLELAKDRGKGPWFPGLMQRIQSAITKMPSPNGPPGTIDERNYGVGMQVSYEVFRQVLANQDVPDYRELPAIDPGTGAINPAHALAAAEALRLCVIVLAKELLSEPAGKERLDLLRSQAIGAAMLQQAEVGKLGVMIDAIHTVLGDVR